MSEQKMHLKLLQDVIPEESFSYSFAKTLLLDLISRRDNNVIFEKEGERHPESSYCTLSVASSVMTYLARQTKFGGTDPYAPTPNYVEELIEHAELFLGIFEGNPTS